MMKRAKGATLAEITKATGWQKHTVPWRVTTLKNPCACDVAQRHSRKHLKTTDSRRCPALKL